MTIFVNLTSHAIHLPTGEVVEPIGYLARCEEETVPVGAIGGVPLIVRRYGAVTGLPPEHPDTFYIVSHMARVACPDRLDLVSPGDLIRDEKGVILGCKNLVVNTLGEAGKGSNATTS
jgi:hypothetical protein